MNEFSETVARVRYLRSAEPSGRLQTALRSHERCNRHARFRNRNDPILSAAA